MKVKECTVNIVLSPREHLEFEIEIKLFFDKCPVTCLNFVNLLQDKKNGYIGTDMVLAVPYYLCVFGDNENNDGSGGMSSFGLSFEDENFVIDFLEPYRVAMFTRYPNSNSSMFCITLIPSPWLSGNLVAFGEVTKGFDALEKFSLCGSYLGFVPQKIEIVKTGIKEITLK